MKISRTVLAILLAGTAFGLEAGPASAQADHNYVFDMPAQDLGESLRTIAARAGWELYASATQIEGLRAAPLHGSMTAREAIELLLSGSRLEAKFSDKSVVIRARPPAAQDDKPPQNEQIVVTGTHIRGAELATQVVSVSRATVQDRGQADLGEATRAIPQNFGGGQNPGVGSGAGLINSNVNSASSVNLRGLGPDATLTLLDGQRLPYDSAGGGVDISAIPVAAIDRVEIVVDGASAVYGSDAVGGVVNVVLRRDARGLATSFRIGAATDGGDLQQQADVTYGTSWSGGNLLIAYDYAHNTAIRADQRDYLGALAPATSLYPAQRHHAVTLAARQELARGVTLAVDVIYSHRTSQTIGGTVAAPYLFQPRVETFSVAPRLDVELGAGWQLKALGAFGLDRTHYLTTYSPAGLAPTVTSGCFCNRAWSAELGAEGPLFELGGGSARLAVGAGARSNGMQFTRLVNGSSSGAFDVARHSRFAYGEIFMPIFGADQHISGIDHLNASAAVRYEDYPGMAQVATPRFGLVYAPFHDLDLKASWSRSFKAPTLYQQYTGYQTYLLPGAAFGAGPAGSTVLYASGGNPALKPERARSWSAGFAFHPTAAPELTISANWFDVRYKDRVVQPIAGSIAAAFRDPGYANLIGFGPAASDLATLIAGAQLGLQNFSGTSYDPSKVYALVDNRNRNVAVQSIHGIDFKADWNHELGADKTLSLALAGTWLVSSQQLTPELPDVELAGTIFNPTRTRLRGDVAYRTNRELLGAAVTYLGALADKRFAIPARINPTATFDLYSRYDVIPGPLGAARLSVGFVVNNLFDRAPPVIGVTGPTDTPYDSTNYSPIGRFLALTISSHW